VTDWFWPLVGLIPPIRPGVKVLVTTVIAIDWVAHMALGVDGSSGAILLGFALAVVNVAIGIGLGMGISSASPFDHAQPPRPSATNGIVTSLGRKRSPFGVRTTFPFTRAVCVRSGRTT